MGVLRVLHPAEEVGPRAPADTLGVAGVLHLDNEALQLSMGWSVGNGAVGALTPRRAAAAYKVFGGLSSFFSVLVGSLVSRWRVGGVVLMLYESPTLAS